MKKVMGFWRCWGLVVGIMIGNGIFMLPAVLAPFGKMSLLGWVIAGVGTLFIALMFGLLAKRNPMIGGPYAYTRQAFGDLTGFLIGWGYWIGVITAVAAGSLAITGYLGFFFPSLTQSPMYSGLVSLSLIWLVTGLNVTGIKASSTFQLVTSLFKILPLFIIAGGGLFIGEFSNTTTSAPKDEATFFNISEMIMIIMWAYVGVEAVTLPSDDMILPQKNIPKALILGTLTVMAVYLLISYGVMALVPLEHLANSTSPIADAASVIFGPWGAALIAIVALVSIISNVNANVFIVGVMPQAMSQDNIFPKYFASLNKSGAPAAAIVFSGILASLLVVMNFSEGLIEAFKTLILLSTLATLLPYVTSAMAELVLQKKEYSEHNKRKWSSLIIALVALVFSIFALIGSGLMIALQGTILIAAGLPFYYWSKRRGEIILAE
ncbi:APC family permease [Paraglaciecola sp. MB-3u-78]|uniref:APC family permease n=1 Tax=Paraglaciecola sp. MB-3u-78 TaxID=2058332 RepID=UPI000C33E709|nr:amino acid permease [Paraglaciecola sp. MB-3u-78]PKG97249.1 amino acid permease [Paraglaciecola sp. MB-3u-78]